MMASPSCMLQRRPLILWLRSNSSKLCNGAACSYSSGRHRKYDCRQTSSLRLGARTFSRCSSSSSSSCSSSSSSSHQNNEKDDNHGPLHTMYQSLVKQKDVQPDPHQLIALLALERLRRQLLEIPPPPPEALKSKTDTSAAGSGFMGSWFSQLNSTVSEAVSAPPRRSTPRGVYLHGGVGCGKTFLMNLFYDSLEKEDFNSSRWAQERQKTHFHKFMLKVHQGMHIARYSDMNTNGGNGNTNGASNKKSDSILPAVIDQIAANGRLVCLDEFQVTDVADALILQRLFTGLLDKGCVLVATSNRPPNELYWNGIQRDRFLPFIDLLQERCEVVSMWDSEIDYRLIQRLTSGTAGNVFFVGKNQLQEFDALFYDLAGPNAVRPTSLQTQGRRIAIPQAVVMKGIARFTFEDLCQKALGAADYLTIGQHFHTVFVERIPILTLNEINWVRRFITFVDSMYESNVKLILQAQTPTAEMFQRPLEDNHAHDEVFAFDRTLSRLDEMASQKYLLKRWAGTQTGRRPADLRSSASEMRVEPS